jgi:sigma-E factor negative regulatory protein RseA
MNMNDEVLKRREIISALADGQLRGEEFTHAVHAVAHDADAQATWDTYHLVGDVLRTGALGARARDQAFVARFAARLQREPVTQRPQPATLAPVDLLAGIELKQPVREGRVHAEAANAPSFRWKMVAGLASLAAVGAFGWNMLGGPNAASGQPQLALAPAAVSTAASGDGLNALPAPAQPTLASAANEPQVMIRDPRLDELLAAHKQFGGNSALQMPAGFLRNATFEGGGR